MLVFSSESFYTDASSDAEERTEEVCADSNIKFTPHLPVVFALADQLSEEQIDVRSLNESIQT